MSIRDVTEADPQSAVHFANGTFDLTVVAVDSRGAVHMGGIPAVLRDESGGFYSAELVEKDGRWIAYFVNGYGDESTARFDAGRRYWA